MQLDNQLVINDAILTERGILYNDIFYSCQAAIKEHWFEKNSQETKIKAIFDPHLNIVVAVISKRGVIHEVSPLPQFSCKDNSDYFIQMRKLKKLISSYKTFHDN